MSELNRKMNRYKAMNVAKNEEIRFNKNVNNFKVEKKKLSSGLIYDCLKIVFVAQMDRAILS